MVLRTGWTSRGLCPSGPYNVSLVSSRWHYIADAPLWYRRQTTSTIALKLQPRNQPAYFNPVYRCQYSKPFCGPGNHHGIRRALCGQFIACAVPISRQSAHVSVCLASILFLRLLCAASEIFALVPGSTKGMRQFNSIRCCHAVRLSSINLEVNIRATPVAQFIIWRRARS